MNSVLELAKIHREVQKERDRYIHQSLISVLTMFAVFIGANLASKYVFDSLGIRVALAIVIVLFTFLTSWHLFLLHRANHKNKEIAEQLERQYLMILSNSTPDWKIDPNRTTYHGCHMWLWQSSLIVVGAIGAILTMFGE